MRGGEGQACSTNPAVAFKIRAKVQINKDQSFEAREKSVRR